MLQFRVPLVATRALLVLMLLPMSGAMANQRSEPSIRLELDAPTKIVTASIQNETPSTIHFYDSVSSGRVPAFVSVKIESLDGVLLSRSEVSHDGFVSSSVLSSTLLVPPVALTKLETGQEVKRSFDLLELLLGMQRYLDFDVSSLEGRCVTLRMMVYTDQNLSQSVSTVSGPTCL